MIFIYRLEHLGISTDRQPDLEMSLPLDQQPALLLPYPDPVDAYLVLWHGFHHLAN